MTGDPSRTHAPLSCAHGTSEVPLLGDTVGADPDRAVAAYPGREAWWTWCPAGAGRTPRSARPWTGWRAA